MRRLIKTHRVGEQRIITKFLLFPKTINHEMRWLEYSTYTKFYGMVNGVYKWYDLKWID